MRRSLALAVLVLLVAVPAMQLWCTSACTPQRASRETAGCEHAAVQPATSDVVAVGERQCCGATAMSADLSAKGRELTPPATVLIRGVRMAPAIAIYSAPRPLVVDANRPPGSSTIPLRI